jgi:lipoate-protein ligase A
LFDHLCEVHDPEPHAAALNMAIDEALLRTAREPLLRIYRWARPAVSFGYFGKWADVHRAWPEREAVRRWTGGGIVPHGDDLTYSLIVPREHPFASLVRWKVIAPSTRRSLRRSAARHSRLAQIPKSPTRASRTPSGTTS